MISLGSSVKVFSDIWALSEQKLVSWYAMRFSVTFMRNFFKFKAVRKRTEERFERYIEG